MWPTNTDTDPVLVAKARSTCCALHVTAWVEARVGLLDRDMTR